jgi:hypothetical protein
LKIFADFKKNVSCAALKKLTAILLLALFAFNTVGYRLWIEYTQARADAKLEAKLDNGYYNEDELITVKIPINLPYQTNWKEFERIDGEMNVNGIVYKYVKRMVYNDTLILLCIPHEEKIKLQEKANDYFGKVNDLPGNENSKKAEVFKQLTADYDLNNLSELLYSLNKQTDFNLFNGASLMHQYIPLQGQPPEILPA